MTIFELSLLSAAGIIIAFAMGFLAGIGYQQTEDRRLIRKKEDRIAQMGRQVDELSKELKIEKKERADREWRDLIENPVMPWDHENLKFGDEN